jgi:hypothetical protein
MTHKEHNNRHVRSGTVIMSVLLTQRTRGYNWLATMVVSCVCARR